MKRFAFLITVFILYSLSGCQEFSVTDKLLIESIRDSEPETEKKDENTVVPQLSLSLSQSSVDSGDIIDLSPKGGIPPYSYYIEVNSIFYMGDLGSFSGNQYSSGDSVGTVIIVLEDNQGNTTKQPLSLLPPPPHGLSATRPDSSKVELRWNYSAGSEKISMFYLVREGPGDSTTNIPIPKNSCVYRDEDLPTGNRYSYSLTSAAGELYSRPSDPVIVVLP